MDAQDKRLDNFIKAWSNKGSEVADKVTYWNELLGILGVPESELADGSYIEYEKKINWKSSKFHGAIDGYIPKTKVLIEQKSFGVDLSKPESRPNGGDKELITPFRQAKRYDDNLPANEKADYYVLSNFSEIWIYDIRESLDVKPVKLKLSELKKQLHVLDFLVKKDTTNEPLEKEKEVSLAAGELVSKMYNELSNIFDQYKDIDPKEAQRSINTLCVRLVFCLYAEDAGLFEDNQFHDYLLPIAPNRMGIALKKLFEVLDIKEEDRTKEDPFFNNDNPELAKFPYVNGGLFSDQSIVIPPFTSELKDILLNKASRGFDWSDISPTIFGAVFESTLNPETRRQGGMHYTSVENIHKVIDPLFLNDLKAELQKIKDTYVQPAALKEHARKFQEKLANLTFLDPACGSGNFLTETFLSLRKLENEAIRIETNGESLLETGEEADKYIKVSIQQFFGIEINDFAVSVAKTALWIAEDQMMKQTQDLIYGAKWHFLPLQTYTHIHEGNALRMDWDKVINNNPTQPNRWVSYIIGNPPFKGLSALPAKDKKLKEQQTGDMNLVLKNIPRHGKLDYVACWYEKAAALMQNTPTKAAFVSTNSITQGEQVKILWKYLIEKRNVTIIYAYRGFAWDNEAKDKAKLHCVIIGFTCQKFTGKKELHEDENGAVKLVDHINGYLIDAKDIYIKSRKTNPPFNMPKMIRGSQPLDGGGLILSQKEYDLFIQKYPALKDLIRPYMGAKDFLDNHKRYCFWLENVDPSRYVSNKFIAERFNTVIKARLKSTTDSVKDTARDTPYLFSQNRQPNTKYYLAMPSASSEARKYIPIGFVNENVIVSNTVYYIPTNNISDDLWLFSVLMSNVHMIWVRLTTGRLETRLHYSPAVYTNFPWIDFNQSQKLELAKSAQLILDARNSHPNDSLATLYKPGHMPLDLIKAHQKNDKLIMKMYGLKPNATKADILAKLFKMYGKSIKK